MTKDRQEAFGDLGKSDGGGGKNGEPTPPNPKEGDDGEGDAGGKDGEDEHTVPYGKYKAETDRLKERNTELEKQLAELKKNPSIPKETQGKLTELMESLAAKDAELARAQLSSAIERELIGAGCQDAPLLIGALNLDSIKLDESGKLEGLDIEELKKEKPYLFAEPKKISSGADPKGGAPDAVATSTREGLANLYSKE